LFNVVISLKLKCLAINASSLILVVVVCAIFSPFATFCSFCFLQNGRFGIHWNDGRDEDVRGGNKKKKQIEMIYITIKW